MLKRANSETTVLVIIGLFIGAMLGKILIDELFGFRASAASVSEARPPHGRIDVATSLARVAPFQIITPDGSKAYLVKLVDAETGETAMNVFLEAGRTFETFAPVGTFNLKWTSGENWQNDSQMFGPLADYQEASIPLVFREDGDGYSGHTIELIPAIDGNLHSERIRPSKF